MRRLLKAYELPQVVAQIARESGKTVFRLAEEAGLGVNTVWSWTKNRTTPCLPQFLWFLDVAGYRLVLEKKEGAK